MSARGDLSAVLTRLILDELLAEGRYHLPGFGVWTLRYRAARRIRNPVTGDFMQLPPTPEVRFRAAKRLKAKVTKGLKR